MTSTALIPDALRWADRFSKVDPLIVIVSDDEESGQSISTHPTDSQMWATYGIGGVLAAIASDYDSRPHKQFMYGDIVAFGLILPMTGVAYGVDRDGTSYTVMLTRETYAATSADLDSDSSLTGLSAMMAAITDGTK